MSRTKAKTSSSTADWKALGVRVPHELAKAIRILAAKSDKSMQEITVEALQDVLQKYGEKIPKE